MTRKEKIAELYDVMVPDWPGEIAFYRELVLETGGETSLLEIACGTGRVAMQLAKRDVRITGIDIADESLTIARGKATGIPGVEFLHADMRSFDLGRLFPLLIVPGHSFQAMASMEEQQMALAAFHRHLPGRQTGNPCKS